MDFQSRYAITTCLVLLAMFAAGSIGNKFKLSDGWRIIILIVLWGVVFVVCQFLYGALSI